jgi:hypothetical protein
MKRNRRRRVQSTSLLLVLTILLSAFVLPVPVPGQASAPEQQHRTYLPYTVYDSGYPQPFGAEWYQSAAKYSTYIQHAHTLGMNPIRLNRVSWRAIQPVEGGPYDWSVLSTFEAELVAAGQARLTPMVIVSHSPRWATINVPYETDCGAIRADKFQAFASFMSAVVSRYSQPPFNVHHWELGNEPDVDPRLVEPDAVFGCWGNIDDPYYGGRHYGNMLKVVAPAIRAADPKAQIIIGGLLLDRPDPVPGQGNPQRFLEGILVAGAAPHLDIVAYHVYPWYLGEAADVDLSAAHWASWGGATLGKARFLRQVMSSFGVSKPLLLNETGLGCPEWLPLCVPPTAAFFQAQADYVGRTFARGRSEDVTGFIWYTLNGPGWRNTGLLDEYGVPRPVYWAYQQLASQLNRSIYERAVDYGPGVEAYSFLRGKDRVHVAWSKDYVADTIRVPQSVFVAAYDRDGTQLTPVAVNQDYQFTVGFSPIYVVLKK